MSLVCGVDVGSLRTLSYVAWLDQKRFVLDLYVPSIVSPLPQSPDGQSPPAYIGFDVPQGLPAIGRTRRVADEDANTPTRKLPNNRAEMGHAMLYKGLVEAGVEMFWAIHSRRLATILGLPPIGENATTVFETYPRYIIRRLWPAVRIPSKRAAPLEYVDTIWGLLRAAGYTCEGVTRPAVDHLDAMLCALAAEAMLAGGTPRGTTGRAPVADDEERVIREGYIVAP